MEKQLKKFKALSDKTRLRILKILMVKKMCVCEIRQVLDFSMATISNHLKILTEADFVKSEKVEKYVNYNYDFKNEANQKFTAILDEMNDDVLSSDKAKALEADRCKL